MSYLRDNNRNYKSSCALEWFQPPQFGSVTVSGIAHRSSPHNAAWLWTVPVCWVTASYLMRLVSGKRAESRRHLAIIAAAASELSLDFNSCYSTPLDRIQITGVQMWPPERDNRGQPHVGIILSIFCDIFIRPFHLKLN